MSLDQILFLPPEQQEAILNGPALAPPEGAIPQFDNPPNNNTAASAALTICLILSILAAMIQFCSRVFIVKAVRLEDLLAFAGFGLYVGYLYMNYWLLNSYGFFVH
ncbi:Uu.00g034950.m01.CDS01 [Anthostomella pinea]|uniref:Uu.00g034950.m01.CDS01 n=1 Tax=Anthostomella pinea TaxID=933095 RepID=A0AAI8YDE7_9PEZI|nr:Uu.00g034950.m01.CDS01 [Anthostomella pinea]